MLGARKGFDDDLDVLSLGLASRLNLFAAAKMFKVFATLMEQEQSVILTSSTVTFLWVK